MESENKKFVLPSPVFTKVETYKNRFAPPHFMTPQGMLMPKQMQPPPMYGPRGSTIPPKYFKDYGKDTTGNHVQQVQEKVLCEICDWTFSSDQELQNHRNEHRKCCVDDCNFFAHPKIIQNHIEQQHNTGLYDSIRKLNTPEEIAKWREERKRKYPTKANVELRRKFQLEKMKRGEKLSKPKNRFGEKQDRKRAVDRTEKPTFNRTGRPNARDKEKGVSNVPETKEKVKVETPVIKATSEQESDIQMFEGSSKLEDYVHHKPKANKNVLTSLLGAYADDGSGTEASDEEVEQSQDDVKTCDPDDALIQVSVDEEEAPAEMPSVKVKESFRETTQEEKSCDPDDVPMEVALKQEEAPEEMPSITVKENFEKSCDPDNVPSNITMNEEEAHCGNGSSDEAPEEIPTVKVKENFGSMETETILEMKSKSPKKPAPADPLVKNHSVAERRPKRKSAKRTSGLNYSALNKTKKNTMLEKLLQPEIIHERNVLLQCIRYVVENKFFNVGSKNEGS